MKLKKNPRAMFAVCVDNEDYPAALELHKIYTVLPDEDAAEEGQLRIVDESGEDYLYPAHRFMLVDVPRDLARELRTRA